MRVCAALCIGNSGGAFTSCFTSTFAPSCIRRSAVAVLPFQHAKCRGVRPQLAARLTSALASMRMLAVAVMPFHAAAPKPFRSQGNVR